MQVIEKVFVIAVLQEISEFYDAAFVFHWLLHSTGNIA
jgi:hypothetical protein